MCIRTYGNLRSQPIGRVPSVLDLSALADSSIEIVGTQSTMDIHEQFSQSRSSKISSLHHQQVEDIEKKEHFGLRPGHINKTRQEQQQKQDGVVSEKAAPPLALETLDHPMDLELDESERQAMEQFEAEHPGWARFDVDIVIKTVVYAGELSHLSFRLSCLR